MNKPIIPEGFTYLIHLSNLSKEAWTKERINNLLNNDTLSIDLGVSGLSVITREDAQRDGKSGAEAYLIPTGNDPSKNQIIEFRVVFFVNFLRHKNREHFFQLFEELDSRNDITQILNNYYIRNPRHPFVPKKTILKKLYSNNENGRLIFYYVPEEIEKYYNFKLKDNS